MFRKSLTHRLEKTSSELRQARDALRIVDEQLAQLTDEADDARLRSLVSEAPEAAHEHRDAAKALDAARRDREGKLKRVDTLEGKLDALLDRLSSESVTSDNDDRRGP
jgi:predicted  nucleic acid-binding Zn-ribbon protein